MHKTNINHFAENDFYFIVYFSDSSEFSRAAAWSVEHGLRLRALQFNKLTGNDLLKMWWWWRDRNQHTGESMDSKPKSKSNESISNTTQYKRVRALAVGANVVIVSLTFVTWNFVLGRHDFVWEKWKRKDKYLWIGSPVRQCLCVRYARALKYSTVRLDGSHTHTCSLFGMSARHSWESCVQ